MNFAENSEVASAIATLAKHGVFCVANDVDATFGTSYAADGKSRIAMAVNDYRFDMGRAALGQQSKWLFVVAMIPA